MNTQYEIILYVADQQQSRDFYSAILQKTPALDVPGMTEANVHQIVSRFRRALREELDPGSDTEGG